MKIGEKTLTLMLFSSMNMVIADLHILVLSNSLNCSRKNFCTYSFVLIEKVHFLPNAPPSHSFPLIGLAVET